MRTVVSTVGPWNIERVDTTLGQRYYLASWSNMAAPFNTETEAIEYAASNRRFAESSERLAKRGL